MSSGFHSRGYLPHFAEPGSVQSITIRLHGAVPLQVVRAWMSELDWQRNLPASDRRTIELKQRIEKYLDAGHGACWLGDQRVAELVERALLHFDGQRYELLAWCVMPNHVHSVIELRHVNLLADILHSWKSYTAQEANKLLNRSGRFWFRDYHDRFIRDQRHFASAVTYVEGNPVAAGLVSAPQEWRWSSAWHRQRRPPETR